LKTQLTGALAGFLLAIGSLCLAQEKAPPKPAWWPVEVDKALARLGSADEETRRVIEAMAQSIVNKILHAPMVKLRDSSRAGHGPHWIESITELFGLRGAGKSRAKG